MRTLSSAPPMIRFKARTLIITTYWRLRSRPPQAHRYYEPAAIGARKRDLDQARFRNDYLARRCRGQIAFLI